MATTNEQLIQARRDYYKNWRKKNKDKIKEYNKKFWLKQADMVVCSLKSENKP